jgi:hypothetical protein
MIFVYVYRFDIYFQMFVYQIKLKENDYFSKWYKYDINNRQ